MGARLDDGTLLLPFCLGRGRATSTMVIVEFRIPLPLTVEEFHVYVPDISV